MKRLLSLIPILAIMQLSFAQAIERKQKTNLEFYYCDPNHVSYDACTAKTEEFFLFRTRDLGCVVNKKVEKALERNNKKTDKKLKKMFGYNWRQRFNERVDECRRGKST
ncbi:hypothetical protein MYP_916 [Sporocytophaga myxococcoides]|uniref:Uncharacterized protein n=1 Tax=Sporocytophaga myxococcoides TaxID=153721 RepID=A0A098LB73_9BACT|nr:hypothetical protein [Sporocytophaga myxococcoides]GAL83689.1 hypothetical protein MYP_916 [Sporocytophaga myxococcoides]